MKHQTNTVRYLIGGLTLCAALLASGATVRVAAQERDPFVRYRPPVKVRKVTVVPVELQPPSIQDRIANYRAQKMNAMAAQRPAPKPTTAFLLSELQVTGIFRTPRGYAAMVEATPIKLSYVIYPGETFYDGQLVAIEEDRLTFRREVRWNNGKVEKTVESKPLRKANAVMDSMNAQHAISSDKH
jgi:hypothetical protein